MHSLFRELALLELHFNVFYKAQQVVQSGSSWAHRLCGRLQAQPLFG